MNVRLCRFPFGKGKNLRLYRLPCGKAKLAALPPSVRKGLAFPGKTPMINFARLSLAKIFERMRDGKAKPYRTEGGRAALTTQPRSAGVR
jgi:hypothetical protein